MDKFDVSKLTDDQLREAAQELMRRIARDTMARCEQKTDFYGNRLRQECCCTDNRLRKRKKNENR